MACNTKPGPAAYIDLIEAATGSRITQSEWHQLRQVAESDQWMMSRTRTQTDVSQQALRDLRESLTNGSDDMYDTTVDEARVNAAFEAAEKTLSKERNTMGTVSTVGMLAKFGPRRMLNTLRWMNSDDYAEMMAQGDEEPYTVHCSICDGVGHGQPGFGPCPLEIGPDDGFEEWEQSQGRLSQSEAWALADPNYPYEADENVEPPEMTEDEKADAEWRANKACYDAIRKSQIDVAMAASRARAEAEAAAHAGDNPWDPPF